MSFPTDWDIDKYKVGYESEEHWELRRRFLAAHKSKFPEDRLVCLAQVFYNVEFMGCRYPEKTMQLVAKLSKGVADEHREKMKSKLQRTFVQASDAASTKVKGRKGPEVAAPTSVQAMVFQKSSDLKTQNFKRFKPQHEDNNYYDPFAGVPGRYVLADQSRFQTKPDKSGNKKRSEESSQKSNLSEEDQIFSKMVIIDHGNPASTLANSASASKMLFKFDVNRLISGESEVTASINHVVLSRAVAKGVSEAKTLCAEKALKNLRKHCFTLVMKDRFGTSIPVVEKGSKSPDKSTEGKNQIEFIGVIDAKAQRMMKLMGWGGKGLGKEEQGIGEPIMAAKHVHRAGLGADGVGAEFQKHIREMLQNFLREDQGYDLVFAADFSQAERAVVHRIASRFGLKSTSYGVQPNRQLIVSKKRLPWQIVEQVLKAGGSTEKYEVIPPTKD